MKKLSQINESLWSKGIERSKSGNERIEDRLQNTNLYNLKSIDLGLSFLLSDNYFEIDEKNKFLVEELNELLPEIKKTGWRLMTLDEVKELQEYIGNHNHSKRYIKSDNYNLEYEKDKLKPYPWGDREGFSLKSVYDKPEFIITDKKTNQHFFGYLSGRTSSSNSIWVEKSYSIIFQIPREDMLSCELIEAVEERQMYKSFIRLVKDK